MEETKMKKLETYGQKNIFKRLTRLFKFKKGWVLITPVILLKKYDLTLEEE